MDVLILWTNFFIFFVKTKRCDLNKRYLLFILKAKKRRLSNKWKQDLLVYPDWNLSLNPKPRINKNRNKEFINWTCVKVRFWTDF